MGETVIFFKKHQTNIKTFNPTQKEQARLSPAIPLNVSATNLIYEYVDSTYKYTLQAKVDPVQWSYTTFYITTCST